MNKKYITYVFILLILVSMIYLYTSNNKRIITVGVMPNYYNNGVLTTLDYNRFESNNNVVVSRFLSYYAISDNTSWNTAVSQRQIHKFLYNQSINHIPELVLTFHGNHPLASIINGTYDKTLYWIASELKNYSNSTNKVVYVRPMGEFFGDWTPDGIYNKNNSKTDFIPAFKRVVDILRSNGNTNIKFQLNIGGLDKWSRINKYGNEPYSLYYPGDNYVDEFSIDVYNMGAWTPWISFEDLTRNDYNELSAISSKPSINIGETSSSSYGGNKTQWILDTFKSVMCDFPRMNNIDWFFVQKNPNTNTKTDIDLTTNEQLQAFKKGLIMINEYNNGNYSICNKK